MSKTRTFRVTEGRVVFLPLSTLPGPGQANVRLDPGDEVTLDAAKVDRFVRGRRAAGDLLEVTPSSPREHGHLERVRAPGPDTAAPAAPAPELDTAPARATRKEK